MLCFFKSARYSSSKVNLAVVFFLGMDVLHHSRKILFADAKRSIPVLPSELRLMFIHPL